MHPLIVIICLFASNRCKKNPFHVKVWTQYQQSLCLGKQKLALNISWFMFHAELAPSWTAEFCKSSWVWKSVGSDKSNTLLDYITFEYKL